MNDVATIYSQLRASLQGTPFFRDLNPSELDELITHLRMVRVQKGYEIVKQGDPGDAFYLIASGKVSIWLKKDTEKSKIGELGKGDFFGERALVGQEPRDATVVAEETAELFILHRHDFDKVILKNPGIAGELRKTLSDSLNKSR